MSSSNVKLSYRRM
ncbi:BgTH12-02100 [Blumeria graminis f. sp. triticale]|uniref:BgTH12-02100 n=1 Tax=Blumeria graminis f. sp. triticale TaxID=1689686 RepID=A0A9W4DHI1_BLUGR|nr:BgTH12-02100 [Blumeria graminis f. sp. triticale]